MSKERKRQNHHQKARNKNETGKERKTKDRRGSVKTTETKKKEKTNKQKKQKGRKEGRNVLEHRKCLSAQQGQRQAVSFAT
jgi:hypothetical protein